MSAELHSFIDVFDAYFNDGEERVQLRRITIPIIQRDYAQGRTDPDTARVRRRFLDSLYRAVTEEPITLDFIYGDIDSEGNMTPLDGQQRLTTLFLLHWYAAKKENIPEEEWRFLERFSYETRYSARYFCEDLIGFMPRFGGRLSDEIINQAWFPLEWKKDPTIAAMLVMLDAISERFNETDDLWGALKNRAITFWFLPIREMGLTDDLYIKMNSRGKPLTMFEHFKAELDRGVRQIDETLAKRLMYKTDRVWTDLLWEYRSSGVGTDEDHIIDDEFLRYFRFVCDVLCYRQGESPSGKSSDEFDLLKRYYSPEVDDAVKNVETMERFFDCWCEIPGYQSPSAFLASFMSREHEEGKIVVDTRYPLNIFEDCIRSYSDKSGRIRRFPLNRIVLLYAVTCYLQHHSEVSRDDFLRRIRIINNLILNSEDEISDRTDRNRIPAILAQVDAVMLTGRIDDSIENSFNVFQLKEEKEKIEFLRENPSMAQTLFRLEDHELLKGQISILGTENLSYAERFCSLFRCDRDRIDRALMAVGDYGQRERNGWRYQYGSTMQYAWNELFHKSANEGFDRTKKTLVSLLAMHETFTNEILDEIIDGFIADCERESRYPFRYYYVKYPVYRPHSFGKLSNANASAEPYLFSVMQTRSHWSQNTYMPFLKAADDEHLSRDDMGQALIYGDEYLFCTNDAYVRRNFDHEPIETVMIAQDENGIDTEDRIIKLKEYIESITE